MFHFDNLRNGMGIESEILADLYHLLADHGVRARWKDINLLVLVSRVKRDQQIDIADLWTRRISACGFPRRRFLTRNPGQASVLKWTGWITASRRFHSTRGRPF